MSRSLSLLMLAAAVGGCSTTAPVFDWFHPLGGEHLFAFDAGQCREQSRLQGAKLSTDLSSPFFRCMRQRGYSLVDAEGDVVGAGITTAAVGAGVSQQ